MENKNHKFNTIRFNITANRLLKMPIETIGDVKSFYIGVNNLAYEISSDSNLINKLHSVAYSDNTKFFRGINYILGYGQVIGRIELFKQELPRGAAATKKVNLDVFLEKNPHAKSEIAVVRKEATVYFNGLKNVTDETMKEVATVIIAAIRENTMELREIAKAVKEGFMSGGGLGNTSPKKENITVTYIAGIGKLLFNDNDSIIVEGIQKDVIDCLFPTGKNNKISWIEIHDLENTTGEILSDHEATLAKKSVWGAVSEINKKTKEYLESGELLIGLKDNEYWLQYEVKKDG